MSDTPRTDAIESAAEGRPVNPLIEDLGKLAYRQHFWVDEDDWYSCPKAPEGCSNEAAGTECNCGADKHNAKVDALLAKLRETECRRAPRRR